MESTITFTHSTLPNGFHVITDHIPQARAATVRWALRTGSRHDTVPGTAHFFEHLIASSTAPDSGQELAKRLHAISPDWNFFTSHESISAFANVKPAFVPELIRMFGHAASMRDISGPVFLREQQRIAAEYEEEQESYKSRLLNANMAAGYAGHPLEQSIIGPLGSIGAMTQQHCLSYKESFFKAGRMALVVSGPVPHEAVEEMAEASFGTIDSGAVPADIPAPPYRTGHVTCIPQQTFIQSFLLSFPGFACGHPLERSADFMGMLLAQKLRESFLEAGFYSSPACFMMPFSDTGLFLVNGDAPAEATDDALRLFHDIFHRPALWLTEGNFEATKLLDETNTAFSYLNPDTRSRVIGYAFVKSGAAQSFERIVAESEAVTLDGIRTAYNLLSANGCNIAGWGPAQTFQDAPALFAPGPAVR